MKIAIVCSELKGINSMENRIGAANLSLAIEYSKAKCEVSIYFASRLNEHVPNFKKTKSALKEKNISLFWVKEPSLILEGLDPARLSYATYLDLVKKKYNIIHFQASQGLGYYSALAKHLGLDFKKTLICTDVHCPGEWLRESNQELIEEPYELLNFYLEKKSVELSDIARFPSQSIKDWAVSNNWQLSNISLVEPFPILSERSKPKKEESGAILELIFWGRLEIKNGLFLFCEAINRLPNNFLKNLNVSLTFIGQPGVKQRAYSATEYISLSAKKWTHDYKIIDHLSFTESLDYIIKSKQSLVILPNLADSLGNQIFHCLNLKIPFIASNIQTHKEILGSSKNDHLLFEVNAFSLSEKIKSVLSEDLSSFIPQLSNRKKFKPNSIILERAHLITNSMLKTFKSKMPLISICLTHRNRPKYLKQCLDSILSQTYQNYEIILIDDASEIKEACSFLDQLSKSKKHKNLKVFRQAIQAGPSVNRNLAAKLAKGDYLLFMDDDNIAKPTQLETFLVAALTSNSDILTCACDRFNGDVAPVEPALKRWVPIGDTLSIGLFYNLAGDMNFFIKKKVFRALGGLSSQKINVGGEDAEFLINAIMKGYSLNVVPQALFWYRYHGNNLSDKIDYFETLMNQTRPFQTLVKNKDLKSLISFTLGMWFRRYYREDKWDKLFPKIKK